MSTVSVAMPAYNAAEWIEEALESILAQTRLPDEIVVVDDGSTDDTVERARRFGERVRVVSQENQGVAGAFNRAIEEASSDWVALCPADDIWLPQKLEWQLEAAERNPEADVIFGAARVFGAVDRPWVEPPGTGLLEREPFVRAMFHENVIADPSAMISRALFDRIGLYDRDFLAEDYEFWMRALAAGAVFYYEPRLVVRLRQHDANASGNALNMWESAYRIHERYASAAPPGLADRILARDLLVIGRCQAGVDQVREGRRTVTRSLRRRPSLRGAAYWLLLSAPGIDRLARAHNARRGR